MTESQTSFPNSGGRPLRVLHFPWNTGGHAAALAAAERAIGLDSRSLCLLPNRYGHRPDGAVLTANQSAFAAERARWRMLGRALEEADVVHYTWGEALFSPPPPGFFSRLEGPLRSRLAVYLCAQSRRFAAFHDLAALRRKGKIIAVTFMGDDMRQGDRLKARYPHSLADAAPENYGPDGVDRWKRRQIQAFAKHAQIIQAINPDLLHDLPQRARFMPYATMVAVPVEAIRTANPRLVIVHAPSDRAVKGTAHIIAAVNALRPGGFGELELDIVENVPHAEARRRYARADLVIDQLHAGFYGTFALEAMALGKPVVTFMRASDFKFLPEGMAAELPLISAEPQTLTSVLSALLAEGGAGLVRRGAQSRKFAAKWHDPAQIAASMARAYEMARCNL